MVQTWLVARGGTGHLEVERAIKAIQDDWELCKENHYHNLDNYGDGSGFPRELHGFYWKDNGEVVFFIKSEIFSRLIGSVNRKELLGAMLQQGMLLTTKEGTIMVTKSISGQNSRGFGFRPSAWLGMAEEVKTPTSPSGKRYDPADDLADDVF